MKRFTYVFQCPTCSKFYRTDEPGEPVCSGPSEMRDDHPHEVMRLFKVEKVAVHPRFAERRAAGRLLVPSDEREIEREARILLL